MQLTQNSEEESERKWQCADVHVTTAGAKDRVGLKLKCSLGKHNKSPLSISPQFLFLLLNSSKFKFKVFR